VLIGAAAALLCLISFIVLLALKPPSLRVAGPQELFNVEHKPVTDALSKLPAPTRRYAIRSGTPFGGVADGLTQWEVTRYRVPGPRYSRRADGDHSAKVQ
jgi:hypothetical protein